MAGVGGSHVTSAHSLHPHRLLWGRVGKGGWGGVPISSPHPQPHRLESTAALLYTRHVTTLRPEARHFTDKRKRGSEAARRPGGGAPQHPFHRRVCRNSPSQNAIHSYQCPGPQVGSQHEATAGPAPRLEAGLPREPHPASSTRTAVSTAAWNLILPPNKLLCLQDPLTLPICPSDRKPGC